LSPLACLSFLSLPLIKQAEVTFIFRQTLLPLPGWNQFLQTVRCTSYLHHSMKQSPSLEDNRFSASQEIPRVLWNSKVNFSNQNCLPPVPILSQIDLVYVVISHLLKMHLTVVLPSTPVSLKWSLSLRFSHKNPVYTCTLPHKCYMPRPPHSSRFDHRNYIG